MEEDPLFKERFGISTSIRYVPNLIVSAEWKERYDRAWKRLRKKGEPTPFSSRYRRFEHCIERIEKEGDDLFYTGRVFIRFINNRVGYGVFAKDRIAPYTILNHYAGLLKPDGIIDPNNDSVFSLTDLKSYSIDAGLAGNWCRFMNHGPEKNPKTNVVAWEHYSPRWGPRIIFTASYRGIERGDQLLYSYGDDYWHDNSFLSL